MSWFPRKTKESVYGFNLKTSLLQAEIKSLKDKLDVNQRKRFEAEEKLQKVAKKAITEIEKERKEKEEKEKTIKILNAENKRLKTDAAKERAFNEQEISKLKSELVEGKRLNSDRSREEKTKQDEKWQTHYERENNDIIERENKIQNLQQEQNELFLRFLKEQKQNERWRNQYEKVNNDLRERDKEIQRLQKENKKLRSRGEMTKHGKKIRQIRYEKVNYDLREKDTEIQRLQKEKEDLHSRLYALTDRSLNDKNPNKADLSDVNRPTKIAENYSQLYDNEWTDAFQELESLQEYKNDGEKKIIKVLFETIVIAYEVAIKKATSELENLSQAIHAVVGDEDEAKELIKQLKGQRKKERVLPDDELKQTYESKVKEQFPEIPSDKPEWIKYRDACINITWLMSIQDPPVYLECGDEVCKSGDKHDRSRYREYIKKGDFIDYPVWPALYIQQGGSMLGRGVAQCKRSTSASVQIRTTMGKKFENQRLFYGASSMEISTQSHFSHTTNL